MSAIHATVIGVIKMHYEFSKLIFAMSTSIFLTILMFFAVYIISYAIVHSGLYTAKKIKMKWKEYRENN